MGIDLGFDALAGTGLMRYISAAVLAAVLAAGVAMAQPDHAAAPPLQVEYGDCATVLAGPRCVLGDDRQLRLWVRADPGTPISVGDGKREYRVLTRFDVLGGRHLHIEVPVRAQIVRVRGEVDRAMREWSVEIAEEAESAALGEVRAVFNQRQFDETEKLLERLLADPDLEQRGNTHRLAGIFYHNRDQPDKARRHYEQAIDINLAEGRWLDALRAASALTFLLQHKFRDFTAARLVYERFEEDHWTPAEGRFFRAYDQGLIGFNSGDARTALDRLSAAAQHAVRMGGGGRWLQRQLDAEEMLASQLQRLGRRSDADAYLGAWQGRNLDDLPVCDAAQFLENVGWNSLLKLEAGEEANDPTALLKEALAVFREHCSAADIANGEINLALAHLYTGRQLESSLAMTRARAATDAPELGMRFWDLDIGARLAAYEGRLDTALKYIETMESLASVTLSPDARWRASARKGIVLEQLGKHEKALEAYAAADARFRQDLTRVPFFSGRGQFVATRDWVTRRRLALLLERNADAEVADLVRQAYRRSFEGLDTGRVARSPQAMAQRERALGEYVRIRAEAIADLSPGWRVPNDELAMLEARREEREQGLRSFLDRSIYELIPNDSIAERKPPPEPGELMLAFHPLQRGWVVSALTNDTVTSIGWLCENETVVPTVLASCLIEPFIDLIDAAERLVILPAGRLRTVDFHVLPFGDGVLLDQLPVVYSLDTGNRGDTRLHGSRALIIGDPTRQLPDSLKEAREVAGLLAQTGHWSVHTLEQDEADDVTVRAGLDGIDLFHFAGHAEYEGEGTWNNALALGGRGRLATSDVFSFARAPALVVLSACDTASTSGMQAGDSVGLAQAFVLNGSTAVLATARPVDDSTALALMRQFYRQWQDGMPADRALRHAQLALRDSQPDNAWSAFRLVVR